MKKIPNSKMGYILALLVVLLLLGLVAALQRTSHTVPMVFANVGDPVAAGFVSSLARPTGNITGFAVSEATTGAKRLELLKQIAPGIAHVICIYDPSSPVWARILVCD